MKFYLIIITGLFVQGCTSSSNNKTGYININDVTNSINITETNKLYLKNIQDIFIAKINQEKERIHTEKQALLQAKNPTQQNLQKAYQLDALVDSVEQLYSKAYTDSTYKYELQAESKINELVYAFGQDNHYSYIYSPAGANSFMYADSTLEITNEVISYINNNTK